MVFSIWYRVKYPRLRFHRRCKTQYLRRMHSARRTSGRRHASGAYETTGRGGARASGGTGGMRGMQRGRRRSPMIADRLSNARMPPRSKFPFFFPSRRNAPSLVTSSQAEGEVRASIDRRARRNNALYPRTVSGTRARRGTNGCGVE